MRRLLAVILASSGAACVSHDDTTRVAQRTPVASASLAAPRVAGVADADARLAAADEKLAAVRTARSWPSAEDRERWVRDLRIADDARVRYESARGTADEAAALSSYEGVVAIAFASRRAIDLGDQARQRP